MKNPKYQRIYADIMKSRMAKARNNQFENVRKWKRYDPMALQLPTVIVAGAKKCGTKGKYHIRPTNIIFSIMDTARYLFHSKIPYSQKTALTLTLFTLPNFKDQFE